MGDDGAARFEQEMNVELFDSASDHARVVEPGRRLLLGVARAESAAEIEIFQVDAQFAKLADESGQPRESLLKRAKSGDLRTDVRADATPANPLEIAVPGVEFACGGPIEAEFMFVVAS